MIGIEMLLIRYTRLRQDDLDHWIANFWVRPDGEPGTYVFHDIDVARIGLILELRDDLLVGNDALPVVLGLLDQVYELRRQLRAVSDALTQIAPDTVRRDLAAHLAAKRA